MLRYTVVLVAVLLIAVVHRPQPAFAGVYDAGWNLVGGPDGSRLIGAEGTLYTWQPGDTAYEALPVNTPLRACIGYWAYFPEGGSLLPGQGNGNCSLTLGPAGWALVGDPSSRDAMGWSGADALFTYSPHTGYQPAEQVFPGTAAWVHGTGLVISGPVQAVPRSQPIVAPAVADPPVANGATGNLGATTAVTSYLLDVSGSGDEDFLPFTTATGAPTVCYAVGGQSPSGLFGPNFAFSIKLPGTDLPVFVSSGSVLASTSGCEVASALTGPGRYELSVIATDWTQWNIRVSESTGTAVSGVRPGQATALCFDGTLDLGPANWVHTCEQHGGVQTWYRWPGESSSSTIGGSAPSQSAGAGSGAASGGDGSSDGCGSRGGPGEDGREPIETTRSRPAHDHDLRYHPEAVRP